MLASEKIDKYISLAGPSETIEQTIVKQITNQSADLGKIAANHFNELKETGNIKNGANIIQIFDSWAGLLDENDLPNYVYNPTLSLVNYIKFFAILYTL